MTSPSPAPQSPTEDYGGKAEYGSQMVSNDLK
jgi:hypothetical protein